MIDCKLLHSTNCHFTLLTQTQYVKALPKFAPFPSYPIHHLSRSIQQQSLYFVLRGQTLLEDQRGFYLTEPQESAAKHLLQLLTSPVDVASTQSTKEDCDSDYKANPGEGELCDFFMAGDDVEEAVEDLLEIDENEEDEEFELEDKGQYDELDSGRKRWMMIRASPASTTGMDGLVHLKEGPLPSTRRY